jgi:predicted thioredoxin/glutaredoxin
MNDVMLWAVGGLITGMAAVIAYVMKRIYDVVLDVHSTVVAMEERLRANEVDHGDIYETLTKHSQSIFDHEGRLIKLEARDEKRD